jgi:Rieske 2Fe-2S family protein
MAVTIGADTTFLRTLPGRFYYDPAICTREQEHIFSTMWVCVGRAEELPGPGAYRTFDLANENILLLRGRDGVLRAFLNVCRHRGARLCSEERGQARHAIQCPYHAWTYALDGSLIGAPNVMEMDAFDRSMCGLMPVVLASWAGLLWVNLADDPPPLDDQVRQAVIDRFGEEETFARYHLDELRVGKTIEYTIHSNWKLVVENFMECYHCGPMHPELCDLLPGFRGGTAYQSGVGTELAAGVEGFTFSGKASRPPLPDLPPADQRKYYGVVALPNVLINLLPDHAVIHTLLPEGPGVTRIVCDWVFHPSAMAEPDFDPMDVVEVFDLVNRQDWDVCELAQQGVHSKVYANGGLFVPSERHIRRFNDFVSDRLGEGS